MENIVSAPKTDMFRFRINPEIKKQVEDVYAKNGLTLTQAMKELEAGENSGELIDEAEAYRLLGVTEL